MALTAEVTVESIPVPSHVHYELLLRLLERQTLPAIAPSNRMSRENIQAAIIMLRKALALQKQFESNCELQGTPVTYRWSLNEKDLDNTESPHADVLPKMS